MNNEQRAQRLEEDALVLITWYTEQPQQMTYKPDREIASELGWQQPRRERQSNWKLNSGQPLDLRLADFHRVSRTRYWVDHNDSPFFARYSFGTRSNGRGGRVSSLNSPELESELDPAHAATDHTVGQVGRLIQSASQHNSELGRISAKLASYENLFAAAGEMGKAIAIAMASSDIYRRSENLFPAETVQRLVDAGLFPS